MVKPINLSNIQPIEIAKPEAAAGESEGAVSFASVLKGAISEARASEQAASDLSDRFAKGDPTAGIHEVMIAQEKAAINVRYAVTLKNKALEAYRELMSTPV